MIGTHVCHPHTHPSNCFGRVGVSTRVLSASSNKSSVLLPPSGRTEGRTESLTFSNSLTIFFTSDGAEIRKGGEGRREGEREGRGKDGCREGGRKKEERKRKGGRVCVREEGTSIIHLHTYSHTFCTHNIHTCL